MKAPVSLTPEELLAVLRKARERRLRDWVILLTIYWHGYRVSEVVSSSTRQLGLFFTRDKAEQRATETGGAVEEVQRRVKGKLRACYVVRAPQAVQRPGLTQQAIEGREITVHRLKGSMETVQDIQEHGNPLLNERLAWEEWLAHRDLHGRKGGAKMQQNNVLVHSDKAADSDRLFGISRWQLWRLYRRYAREAGLPRRKQHPHCLKHTYGTDLIDAGLTLPQVQVALGHKSIASTGQYTLPREDVVSKAAGKAIREKPEFREVRQGGFFDRSTEDDV